MKSYRSRFAIALGALTISSSSFAISIDGNLDDWGVDPVTWIPAVGIHFVIEDQTGAGPFYLNPGWGGQSYDAEAMYATVMGSKLFIALATGHNPDTVENKANNIYGAGDFAIDFGKDETFELGINFARPGDTMTEMGGVYKKPTWDMGLWNSGGAYSPGNPDPAHPTSLKSGVLIGHADFAYKTTAVTGYGSNPSNDHYFYETSLDLALLFDAGWDGQTFNIHWTMNCANDSISVDPPTYVPEPGSASLLSLALVGLLGQRLRKN